MTTILDLALKLGDGVFHLTNAGELQMTSMGPLEVKRQPGRIHIQPRAGLSGADAAKAKEIYEKVFACAQQAIRGIVCPEHNVVPESVKMTLANDGFELAICGCCARLEQAAMREIAAIVRGRY